jgi:hypothetical protein
MFSSSDENMPNTIISSFSDKASFDNEASLAASISQDGSDAGVDTVNEDRKAGRPRAPIGSAGDTARETPRGGKGHGTRGGRTFRRCEKYPEPNTKPRSGKVRMSQKYKQ